MAAMQVGHVLFHSGVGVRGRGFGCDTNLFRSDAGFVEPGIRWDANFVHRDVRAGRFMSDIH